ncbi:UPF0662 protein [Neolecta irregularis DAH-3]|uniref:UPF0662 protein n=1 Tax=Neolecta irregularis (strain DAH-3) TaxID=1198029 RepID=A0A1U7LW85_NEOID|nr:UPF0662 protein [Neolecta irregularis DAH-3]|eukprot:OLL26812.1 UPF0662 protein [Neolecta irregularis DAH-3]
MYRKACSCYVCMFNVPDLHQAELAILERLINLRQRLMALKMDRSSYIKAQDVQKIYETIIKQVDKINEIREHPVHFGEQNRLDTVLDDVLQLLSLFFLAIGRNNSTMATYIQVSTVKRLLDHLYEAGVYTESDLKPIRKRLEEMRTIIHTDKVKQELPLAFLKLVGAKLKYCESRLVELEDNLSKLSPELAPIQQKLVSIRRQMAGIASKPNFSAQELHPLYEELRKIEASRVDGRFLAPNGDLPYGQSIVNGLLEECHTLSQDLITCKGDVAGVLKPIYDRLAELKSSLETLMLTHRWTLRETDLYNFKTQLKDLDQMRVNGKFASPNGDVPEGQTVLLYMLRRCYALLYQLLAASEPVSEALMPVHNQLSTVRKCLIEVKKGGGPFSPRELWPYQMKLASIDNMRLDGKFLADDGTVPEGQATVTTLLAECYDIIYELRSEIEEE